MILCNKMHFISLFISANFVYAVHGKLPCPVNITGNLFNLANYKSIVTDLCEKLDPLLSPCGHQSCEVLSGLENGTYWALKMLDATGKPPTTGLLVGNFHAMGHFTECIEIGYSEMDTSNTFDIKGKYVRIALNKLLGGGSKNPNQPEPFHDYPDFGFPFDMFDCTQAEQDILKGLLTVAIQGGIQLGVCIPSACDGRAVADLLTAKSGLGPSKVVEYEKNNVTWRDTSNPPTTNFNKTFTFENNVLTPIDITAKVVLGIFIVTALVGTAIDVIAHQKEKLVLPTDIWSRLFLCFSIYTNGRKLLNTSSSKGSINCLNGLKFFSMSWVVMGHAWYIPGTLQPWTDSIDVAELFSKWEYQTIFNAALAVDTFFLVGGFLFCFHFLNQLDKSRGKLSPLQVGMMYLHRYIRLTPAFAIAMLLLSTLLAHMAWGPQWDGMVNQRNHCGEAWWSNLLYINNFVNMDNLCLGETWYLACDFQFYILGPLIVYPIWRFRLGGIAWILLCLVISCVIPGTITYVYGWPPTQALTVLAPEHVNWMQAFYMKSYNRASPWVLGLILGLVMNKIRLHETKVKISKLVGLAMWCLSIVLCLAPLYGLESFWPYDLSCAAAPGTQCWNMWEAVSYTSLARLSWSIGIAWVIFACATGNGGFVDTILSWPPFTPLARLTYCCYLLHLHIMYYFFFSRKDVMYYDGYLIFYYFIATLVLANFFSLIFCLLFEAPFIGLEKIIFGRGGGGNKKKENESVVKNGHSKNGDIVKGDEEALGEKQTNGVKNHTSESIRL